RGQLDASTFWAGCGAIRRSVFEEIGGFQAERFRRPSIEDIDLGYRLCGAGHRIRLDPGLQGTHLKRWTLGSIVRPDVACRALYAFFRRQGGNRFAAVGIVLHLLYYLYSGLTYLYARLEHDMHGVALVMHKISRTASR